MDKFINHLQSLTTNNNVSYSIYALNPSKEKIIATQIGLDDLHLKTFFTSALNYLIHKKYNNLQLKAYPFGIPKDHIEYIDFSETDDANLSENPDKLVQNIKQLNERFRQLELAVLSPETNDIDLNNYNSYVIVCTLNDEKTYFIKKKKPLRNYDRKSALFAALSSSEYKKLETNLINLVYHFDCIIYKKKCYFITLETEEMFGLTQYYEKKTNECKLALNDLNLVDSISIEIVNNYLKKPGRYATLKNYDANLLKKLSKVTMKNKKIYENKYHLTFISQPDGTCKIDLSDEQKVHNFINTITNKRGLNFDNLVVESSTPLKVCE